MSGRSMGVKLLSRSTPQRAPARISPAVAPPEVATGTRLSSLNESPIFRITVMRDIKCASLSVCSMKWSLLNPSAMFSSLCCGTSFLNRGIGNPRRENAVARPLTSLDSRTRSCPGRGDPVFASTTTKLM